ncbi:cytochrome ubiquinol oxidase subunit I [Streptomyces bathyalis]|uniref:Cytochrome ubiquinol oxidase subunit I n=1 Tax=Streptomyces bathyalis TaxID=2710756 RepID=A0A7T1T562_9ACTN|nr:cytochrome ubiquinol oxidase subunit I [Streptomyces bathyalis]QPP06572.1 cytochrome ubiquinol oxidase subunit I [Streptomyces bathyalis]
MDDPVFTARLQFALTAGAHFLFVALTLGLVTLVVLMQLRATVTGSEVHGRMVAFWGRLYVINYAVGIVTGLVLEFQFGMVWTGLTRVTGDVFGVPLALETIGAFFIESTFLGLWIFGWDRFNKWVHLAMITVVAATAYASAYFILVTNGWLKKPVGFAMVDGKAVLTDFGAMLTNPAAVLAFWHVFFGALLTAGFFVAGVSAYHLMRRHPDVEFFRRSIRIGMLTVIVSLMPSVVFGGVQMPFMEPSGVETDPPALAQVAFGFMAFDWFVMAWFALGFMVIFFVKPLLLRARVVHWLIIAAVPLPYFAMILGWLTRELNRQPWAVLGILRTEDAVAPLTPGAAQLSFVCFVSLFAVLTGVNFWLLARHARRGPEVVRLGAAGEAAAPLPTPTF